MLDSEQMGDAVGTLELGLSRDQIAQLVIDLDGTSTGDRIPCARSASASAPALACALAWAALLSRHTASP